MNKPTLSAILLGGLLFATPLVQAQTPVPPEPMNEEPVQTPPQETSPSGIDDDSQRSGEDREPEGASPDLNQDSVPDDAQPESEPLPGEEDDSVPDSDTNSPDRPQQP